MIKANTGSQTQSLVNLIYRLTISADDSLSTSGRCLTRSLSTDDCGFVTDAANLSSIDSRRGKYFRIKAALPLNRYSQLLRRYPLISNQLFAGARCVY